MPLNDGALNLIRQALDAVAQGQRLPMVSIGWFTDEQYQEIRRLQVARQFQPLESPEIIYRGRHHYESRIPQGYVVDDLLLQIEWALANDAEALFFGKMTSLRSRRLRSDGYGQQVRDEAIFEMTASKPRAELFSVIPKGDGRKPKTTKPR